MVCLMTRFLSADRAQLAALLPGLDEQLQSEPFMSLEGRQSPAIEWFRSAGGPGLIVPEDSGGLGATLGAAIQVQRAVGSRSPSLAVATTMHHATVATMRDVEHEAGMEWLLMQAIAENRLLIASGVAEGELRSGVNAPRLRAKRVDGGLLLNGSKKPCSLSHSMDLLAVSIRIDDDPSDRWAVAVVTADSPGLERREFWSSEVLAGAESDEVVLSDVFVPERLITYFGRHGETSDPLRAAFVWFELLIAASYLGVASALAERVFVSPRSTNTVIAAIATDLEGAMLALLQVASGVGSGMPTPTSRGGTRRASTDARSGGARILLGIRRAWRRRFHRIERSRISLRRSSLPCLPSAFLARGN